MKNIILISSLFVSLNAQAFLHKPHKDSIKVFLKEERPTLEIWDSEYPDIPECEKGYQGIPDSTNNAIEVYSPFKSGFILHTNERKLWISKTDECLAAEEEKSGKFFYKTLNQSIDVYSTMADWKYYDLIVHNFEFNNNTFGIIYSAWYKVRNKNYIFKSIQTRLYTFEDAKNGKILIDKDEEMSYLN